MEKQEINPKKKKKSIERFIKRYHYRLELIRTVVPCFVLILQIIVLAKLFHIL